MRPILEITARVGPSDANVLIAGENGTGKGVVAQALHAVSLRAGKPFVSVHMGGQHVARYRKNITGFDASAVLANAAGQSKTTRGRFAATRTAYGLAEQALDAEVKRLRARTSSTFFVLQVQGNLADVEIRQIRALPTNAEPPPTTNANSAPRSRVTASRYSKFLHSKVRATVQ